MKLFINDNIIILHPEEDIKNFLREFIFEDSSAVFIGGQYDVAKIKKVKFFKEKESSVVLNSSFWQNVLLTIKKYQINISEVRDERTKFPHQSKNYEEEYLKSFFPFDYNNHQIRAIKKLLKLNYGIIEATTSAGKTSMFSALIKITNLPTLILVNKISLCIQTYNRFINDDIENVGMCNSKTKKNGNVVISTIGSVYKISDLHKFKMLIIDEVHGASAKQFQDFLKKTSYPLRFGFSATPNKGDKYLFAKVKQYVGDVIEKIEANELIENKVIAKPLIQFFPIECLPTLDWPSAYEMAIVKNQIRNNKIAEITLSHKLPTLILVRYIEHGETLNKLIPGSIFVSGIDSAKKRQEVIEKFEHGDLQYLISSNIFNEGISINKIRVLIIASAYKSRTETMQKIGRGLRLDEGKYEVNVFDFDDYGNRFTEKHSKLRKKIYEKAGYIVL